VFADQTAPVLDHYRAAGLVSQIDGLGSPAEVFQRICRALEH